MRMSAVHTRSLLCGRAKRWPLASRHPSQSALLTRVAYRMALACLEAEEEGLLVALGLSRA